MKNKFRTFFNILVSAALAIGLFTAPAEKASAAPSPVWVGQICTMRSGNAVYSKLDGHDSTYHAELFVGRDTRVTIVEEIPNHSRYIFKVRMESYNFILEGWINQSACKTIAPAS